jgi:hypothetical protein
VRGVGGGNGDEMVEWLAITEGARGGEADCPGEGEFDLLEGGDEGKGLEAMRDKGASEFGGLGIGRVETEVLRGRRMVKKEAGKVGDDMKG